MSRPGAPAGGLRLPAERSSFVGRRAELAEARRLLSRARLVTLVGPGGVGKTRLAVRVAGELRRSFPDGATLADLAAVSDPALVVARVAAALDVRDLSGQWLPARIADVVGDRRVLLVLDNCEHVRDAAAVLVDALLTACPRMHVVATSRGPLDVDGEALLSVPPLPVPAAGTTTPVGAPAADAVQLLVERATAAVPGLSLRPEDAMALADICRRLDGLPLAIELAAVSLRALTPGELLARLDDRFALLARSGAAVSERHRTLRATMQWSADLLSEEERTLWRRASVFAAEFDLAAVEAVCDADGALPGTAVVAVLGRLVDASLLQIVPGAGVRRFRMLESVRAYGRELLRAAGEERAVRLRHREWCAGLAAAASADYVGAGQVAALDALDTVHAEIGEALRSAPAAGDEERLLELAADLWLYWAARGHLGEGRRLLAVLLAACPGPSPVRARALLAAGYLELAATDPDSAVPLLQEARDLAAAVGPALTGVLAVQFLGQAALFRGDLPEADRLLREAAARHAGVDPRYQAFAWADVGMVALLREDRRAAADAFARSLTLGEGGDPWSRSHALWGLGLVRLADGEASAAVALEQDALRLMRLVDDRSGTALCLEALAWAAAARCEEERAARLEGAAEAVWRSIPAGLPAPLTGWREEWTRGTRRALGERRWSALRREGAALDRSAAVAIALEERLPRPTPEQDDDSVVRLTPRQGEVADLVAQGLTDREIAERLVISPRTAESHVEQILARLGFRSRAEIAAWTARRAPAG